MSRREIEDLFGSTEQQQRITRENRNFRALYGTQLDIGSSRRVITEELLEVGASKKLRDERKLINQLERVRREKNIEEARALRKKAEESPMKKVRQREKKVEEKKFSGSILDKREIQKLKKKNEKLKDKIIELKDEIKDEEHSFKLLLIEMKKRDKREEKLKERIIELEEINRSIRAKRFEDNEFRDALIKLNEEQRAEIFRLNRIINR